MTRIGRREPGCCHGSGKTTVTTLEVHGCAVLRGEALQLRGVIGIERAAGQAIGVQHGDVATVSPLKVEQAASGTQFQCPVQVEKIGFGSQAPSPAVSNETTFYEGPPAAANSLSVAQGRALSKHNVLLTKCVVVLKLESQKGARLMQGCRDYVAACCRGIAMTALLATAPAISSAQTDPVAPSDPGAHMPPASSLGAHTLLTQPEGLGTSPAVTEAVATQPAGSSLIVFNGGYSSNSARPVDSYANHWKQLGGDVPFGNGYGDRFNVKAYVALSAKGGPAHTVSIAKQGYAAGEISLPFIEIRQAGVLQDVAQNYPQPGLRMTSGSVTTTGPATLIAVWWGDGGIKRMTAVPDSGFTVIDSFLMLPDESGVQCAVAFKQVGAAGTYNLSWIGAPVQGAILWLFAFQSK
jgi:hypothetical protein